MSKTEILAALAQLLPDERREVRLRLDELDGFGPDGWLADGELTESEKSLLNSRLADVDARPERAIPWALAEERLKSRFGG